MTRAVGVNAGRLPAIYTSASRLCSFARPADVFQSADNIPLACDEMRFGTARNVAARMCQCHLHGNAGRWIWRNPRAAAMAAATKEDRTTYPENPS
jgi:hypothetical protein